MDLWLFHIILGLILAFPKYGLWALIQSLSNSERVGVVVWEIGAISIIFGVILAIVRYS